MPDQKLENQIFLLSRKLKVWKTAMKNKCQIVNLIRNRIDYLAFFRFLTKML